MALSWWPLSYKPWGIFSEDTKPASLLPVLYWSRLDPRCPERASTEPGPNHRRPQKQHHHSLAPLRVTGEQSLRAGPGNHLNRLVGWAAVGRRWPLACESPRGPAAQAPCSPPKSQPASSGLRALHWPLPSEWRLPPESPYGSLCHLLWGSAQFPLSGGLP